MALTAVMTPLESGPSKVFTVADESVTLAQLNAAGYLAPYGDLKLLTTIAFTAARTVALPALALMVPGCTVSLRDIAGGTTSSNTWTLTLAGSDQYQGAGTSPKVNAANGVLTIASNQTQWNTG